MQAWDVDHSALAAFHRFLMLNSAGVSPQNSKRADEALRGELPRDKRVWLNVRSPYCAYQNGTIEREAP